MRRASAATASVPVFLSHALAFACSGPGAPLAIARAERFGWMMWFVTFAVLGAFAVSRRLRARGFRKQKWFGVILLVHPGWWLSARGGDCGISRIELSVVVTLIAVVFAIVVFLRAGRAERTSPGSEKT